MKNTSFNFLRILLISTLLFVISCSVLFPPIPEVNENIIDISIDDGMSIYLNEVDSLRIVSRNQTIGDPENFALNAKGWYFVLSPDSSKIAYLYDQEDWAMGYHKILIWDVKEHTTIPVCTFRESDPGSGISHNMYWSLDSKMFHITGMIIDEVGYQWLIFNYEKKVLYKVGLKHEM